MLGRSSNQKPAFKTDSVGRQSFGSPRRFVFGNSPVALTLTPVHFDNPPVAEVACGVTFNVGSLAKLKAIALGHFWDEIRGDFPIVEETTPLPAVMESLVPGALPQLLQVQFQLMNIPPMRRVWMQSSGGDKLIQIQQDRFLFSWKRVKADDEYPSYINVVREFERYLEHYFAFLRSIDIESPKYRQFELSYINLIGRNNGLVGSVADGILRDHTRDRSTSRFLPIEPDSFNWMTSFRLPDNLGRLHINAQPVMKLGDEERLLRLELTARGISSDSSAKSRRAWFDLGHDWITHGFADITSPAVQAENWQRKS